MNNIKLYSILVFCVLSFGLSAQETFKWIRINDSAGNYYEMHRIDFLNSTSLGMEFTISEQRFEHIDMTGRAIRIPSFEYTEDRLQVYFIEDEADLFRYTIATDQLEYIQDLTPETTPIDIFDYTQIDEIFFLNDSILYCGGFTHGFYNINTDTFQKLRDPASFALGFTEFEQEIILSKGTWHKGGYIYSAGGFSNSIRRLEIGDPEGNTELLDFDQFNMSIWFEPIVSYRDACGKTVLYQGGSQDELTGIKHSYWKVDLDNVTIEYSHPYTEISGTINSIGNVKHYKAIDWEDCQRRIDLDADDSSIGGVDFLIDSLCSFDLLPLSDIDIMISNEYPLDSIVVILVSPLSGANISISNGNYDLQSGANKTTLTTNGFTELAEFEEAIRNGFINNLDNVSEIQISFTVWYDGVAGNPAIATYRFAVPLPNAGDDITREYCEGDPNLTLDNILASDADDGGLFYNNQFTEMLELPDYQAPISDTIYYVTTNGICYDTARLINIVHPNPEIAPVQDYKLCHDEDIAIDLSSITESIEWWDGIEDKERTFDQSGIYFYKANNIFGCTTSDTFEIFKLTPPETKPIEAKVCEGEEFTYMDQTYDLAGVYHDTLQSSLGCDSIIYDIDFDYYDRIPIELEGILGYCEEETTLVEVVSEHISITIDGEDASAEILINQAGNYTIAGYDINGCYEELDIIVESFTLPMIWTEDLLDTVFSIDLMMPVDYDGNIVSYLWTPHLGLNCGDCPIPNFVEKKEGLYTIEVMDENGCIAYGEVRVSFKSSNVYLPNVIANYPSIQENGILYLQGNNIGTYSMQVYDRWGNLLYNRSDLQINDSSQGWQPSGKYNPDVFVYKIVYEENGKEKIILSDITVL
ncbi:MAG: hypothetical protein V3V00_03210 [Saprospiraceae bacterium]